MAITRRAGEEYDGDHDSRAACGLPVSETITEVIRLQTKGGGHEP